MEQRLGRVDEAATLLLTALRGGRSYHVNHANQIADVLARHDPVGLADFAAGHGRGYGAHGYTVTKLVPVSQVPLGTDGVLPGRVCEGVASTMYQLSAGSCTAC